MTSHLFCPWIHHVLLTVSRSISGQALLAFTLILLLIKIIIISWILALKAHYLAFIASGPYHPLYYQQASFCSSLNYQPWPAESYC